MSKPNGVFISYRRDGGDGSAGRVRDALVKRGFKVFLDVEDLRSGKFNEALFGQIDSATDFVIILSVGSLDRCVNEGDWVRLEIAHALKQKKNIVPVLGRNFHFPKELPADIDDLRHYNGIAASHDLFDASMDKLAGHLHSKPEKPFRLPQAAGILGAVAAIAIASVALFWRFSPPVKPVPADNLAPGTTSHTASPQPEPNQPGKRTISGTEEAPASQTPANTAAPANALSQLWPKEARPANNETDVLSRLKLLNNAWVTTTGLLRLSYRQMLRTVKVIRLGESADKLDFIYKIPDEPEKWIDGPILFPVRPGSPQIYAQLEYTDGSSSQVQELPAEEMRNFTEEGIRIPALSSASEDTPIVLATIPGSESPDILDLTLIAPRTAKKWKLAFDNIRYPDVEIEKDKYDFSNPPRVGWDRSAQLKVSDFGSQMLEKPLLISWIDRTDREHGPFSYNLSSVQTLLLQKMKRLLIRNIKGEMVWTVSLPKQTYKPNPKQNLIGSGWGGQDPYPPTKQELVNRLAYHGLDFINGEGVWGKNVFGGGRNHKIRWLAVKEIRYGTQEERLDHAVKLDVSPKGFFTEKNYEHDGWTTTRPLPLGSNYIFVQLTFYDGTKSEVIWYKVSDLLTVAWWDED